MSPRPPSLEELQAWLGRAISRPLPPDYRGNPLASSSPKLREQGDAWLQGRGGLSGFDRAGIYNQQYWFRLISIMQEEYPCVVHLMGLRPFNQRVIRYLTAHPPDSPYLARLDEAWPGFLEEDYREPDRGAVLQAAAFDRAFSRAVDAPDGRPLASPAGAAADPLSLALQLAPHATVLGLDWDFVAFRTLCLDDKSLEKKIGLEPGASTLVIWRGADMSLWQEPVSATAGKVLMELRRPTTLPEVFGRLEGSLGAEEQGDLEAHLAPWFAAWVRDGWICAPA